MASKTRKRQIEELLTDDPKDPFLRYGLAMEYVSLGEDENAINSFRDLFAIQPDYVPAYLQISQALIRLDRTAEARDMLTQGIAHARRQGDLHAAEEMQGFLASLGG